MRTRFLSLLVPVTGLILACTTQDSPRTPPSQNAGNKNGPGPVASRRVSHPRPAARPGASADSHSWSLRRIGNLRRLGKLSPRQKKLLNQQGFFLAPQPSSKPKDRATHLFHLYERNDYIAFPSFVTADLAIDATHAYFDAVLREVESQHLVSRLQAALTALLGEAEKVRQGARGAKARQAAARAVTYWAVALRLLEQPARGDVSDKEVMGSVMDRMQPRPRPRRPAARPRVKLTPIPGPVRRDVRRTVLAVQAARGKVSERILKAPVDLTQMRPRGHYTRTGVLQRLFRSMSWLGMAAFPVKGPQQDVIGVALLARSYLGSTLGREGLKRVKAVTSFFVGGPDAADLEAAAKHLAAVQSGAATARADVLVRPALLERYGAKLRTLPPPQISSTATSPGEASQVRVLGRRAFEDNVALQRIIGALNDIAAGGRHRTPLVQAPGALGSAALLGSDLAQGIVVGNAADPQLKALDRAFFAGRKHIAGLPAARWGQDAYHGTLHALRALLPAPPATAPRLLRTPGWRLRALQAFASGWAELRHDTILYGEQSGAECDAPDPPAPPGWVEPVPEVYSRLAKMVQTLDKRLRAAGIPVKSSTRRDNPYARPLAEKTKTLVLLLHFLRDAAEQELRGKALTAKQRKRITLIGGEVEWLLISLANTDLLARRDQDMAVIADVFTWRSAGKAVEVAVGHPELIYAIIPGPKGPVIARGAVMSYREFLQPVAKRLTDEEWRGRLTAGKAPARPAWLKPVYAEPVPFIQLVGKGVSRCSPSSGTGLKL